MHVGLDLFFFVICICSSVQIKQELYRHRYRIFRRHRAIFSHDISLLNSSSILSTTTEPILFFQNEPIPLASSVVDDLTTLASAIYIICLIITVFILLAWFTHYNAPCSSIITSILSSITGLPEPIIQSVALCGSCCMWCETTWLFRRIHQFNIWMSNKIKQFLSITCKTLFDTICPCCRPPDTPSNRSIIGSLPTSIIAMINVSDAPDPSPPKPIVTVLEPTSTSSRSLTVNVDVYPQPKTESLIENQDHSASNSTPIKTKIDIPQVNVKKGRKRPRKRTQSKQRSAMDEISQREEQIDDINENEDDEDDEDDEDTGIY